MRLLMLRRPCARRLVSAPRRALLDGDRQPDTPGVEEGMVGHETMKTITRQLVGNTMTTSLGREHRHR